jgi:hypothetical protein
MAKVEYAISISVERTSGPSCLTSGRLYLNCDSCLMNERVRMGIHVVQTITSIFPYLNFGKKIWSWSITGSRPDGPLRRPDGCKLEQKLIDVVKGPEGNPRRPDVWCLVCLGVRTVWYVVRTAGREPAFLTCRIFWKYFWIAESLVKEHLYIQVILSKQNEANHKLTKILWVFQWFSIERFKC